MANQELVNALLHKGVEFWNIWRLREPEFLRDLSGADLGGANLSGVDFSKTILYGANLRKADLHAADLRNAMAISADLCGANLSGAKLDGANLSHAKLESARLTEAELHLVNLVAANLSEANLRETKLHDADLTHADLSKADLSYAFLRGANLLTANLCEAILTEANLSTSNLAQADLSGANLQAANLNGATLSFANLSRADLTGALLRGASCLQTDFSNATLVDCHVYGISVWDVNLSGAKQANLRLNPRNEEGGITVDNVEVAQFLNLLLHNEKMRAVLDTITSKVVLILGRFSDERKPVLDALREVLRNHSNGYVPVLFDFDPQQEKPVFETVKILANLARFVIADLTDPNMVRSELSYITANLPTVPVQPITLSGTGLPTEYSTWKRYSSFLPIYEYVDLSDLLVSLNESVIKQVEGHVQARRL